MKLRVYIGVVLMAMMVGCKSPTTSPWSFSVGEGEACRTLVEIDSLMWQQPDSALVMLLEYLSCRDAMIVSSNDAMDTMRRIQCVSTTFDSHYAQLLTSELLFKNNYAQSNRTELLQAVAYFDSLVRQALPLKWGRGDPKTLAVVLPLVVISAAIVFILMRRRSKKHMAVQEAEAQRQISEASQRLSEASQRHDEEQRELQTKVEQAAQHTREILQQRVTDIYQSNGKDRLQRILEAVDDTYPQAMAKLKEEHPELGEAERNILLLNFFHFRIKEEADLLGLSENTVAKYRSNLGKTLGKDPISDWI